MSSDPVALAFCDIETIGQPLIVNDACLEIAVVVTDLKAEDVQLSCSYVLRPTMPGWAEELIDNEYVFNMHARSGLLGEIRDGLPLKVVDLQIAEDLRKLHPEGQYLFAGSGVSHFDRPRIKEWFPEFEALLHYSNLDSGVVRRFLKLAGRTDLIDDSFNSDTKPHRALADTRIHVEETHRYLEFLSRAQGANV